MKITISLLMFLISTSAFANQTLVCSSSKFDQSKSIEGELSLKLDIDSANSVVSATRLKGSWAPFQTEEDYQITDLKLITSNKKASIYNVTGDEGDQSYYNARLIIPNSAKIESVSLEYASSGDDAPLGKTTIALSCSVKN